MEFLRSILEALWRLPARIFGSRNQRLLKQYSHVVERINAFEPALEKLSDSQLREKTNELKKRHAEGA
ncbi:MAG TPA: hypothetical protein VNP36_05310, partial [Burkholderiales bacterium]|nr:hypothetical protein [Burkholderiales bacterium]